MSSIDARSDEKQSSRRAAVIALALVVICIAIQQWGASTTAAVGEGAYGKRAEGLLAEGQFEECVALVRSVLYLHSAERRAHYYLAAAYVGEQKIESALEELVLAATPLPTRTKPLLLSPPTPPQILAMQQQLTGLAATRLPSDWEHFRLSRLAAFQNDWDAFGNEIRSISGRQPNAMNAACADALRPLLSRTLGIPPEHFAPDIVSNDLIGKLLSSMGTAHNSDSTLPDVVSCGLTAMACTSYSGGTHLVAINSRQFEFEATDHWMFLVIDPTLRSEPIRTELDLGALGDSRAALQVCVEKCGPGMILLALASDVAIIRTSPEARAALRDVFGLHRVPADSLLSSFVFAIVPSQPRPEVVEAPAAASDVPAILIIGTDGP